MQTSKYRNIFTSIKTEGAILPAELLQRIFEGREVQGLTPEAYHMAKGEKLNEAINRSWSRLLGIWPSFREAVKKLPEGNYGTGITRERWLFPIFQELGYGRLPTTKAIELEGKTYPISHMWENTPIHLVGGFVALDKRTARVPGAARTSPHGVVQEFLNRSKAHLWAFVSNGFYFRILRDNVSLTRQAYVEFDIETMMESESYADFVVFWLLCHQSRVEAEKPEECWLEKWSKEASKQGIRAFEQLKDGVKKAITALGKGFLINQRIRENLRNGTFDKQDYYRQLLRTVYRILFIFVAESRNLLLVPGADKEAKNRYREYYSMDRLRRLAEHHRGTKHVDLWRCLSLAFEKLNNGCPELALPALGSFLWSDKTTPDITGCDVENRHLLDAVRALAFTVSDNIRRPVDYKNLGAEELGSIYESLLELHPEPNVDAGTFELKTAAGNERKTTGSYYTPTSLITCLLDSALDPVINETLKQENPEVAILNLKICDPACGSGHFLIAAAHRIAKRLASVRTGDDEPSPHEVVE